MTVEVFLQAGLQLGRSDPLFEITHHDRCLVIDDVVVEQAGLVHVLQFLSDGVGSVGTVDGDGACLIGLQEVQVMVDLREVVPCDLRCHKSGEHLLDPDVFKPLQRHEVSEPQVSRLVGNQFQSGCLLFLGGVLLEEDATVAHLYGSGMLHASELVAREHDHPILSEGTGNARISFHPPQRKGRLIEDLVYLGHLGRVCLAV